MDGFPQLSLDRWIALYGAILSTLIAIVGSCRFIARKWRSRKERLKFQTDLYFLRKIDHGTKEVFPIVVALLANLGTERIALKSFEYDGIAENGLKIAGSLGWYEQPEELFGIRNRLLPRIIESGQTVDLPMIEIGVLTRVRELKIWLTDFDDRKYYIVQQDIAKVRHEVQKFLESTAPK